MIVASARRAIFTIAIALACGVPASGQECDPVWSPLGAGVSDEDFVSVFALASFDDGSGPALYAGGYFTQVGGIAATNIARWDGSSWSALGTGVGAIAGADSVRAMTVFDDGSGPALYVAGRFAQAGGAPANSIARWDGSSWSALGSGLNSNSGPGFVHALTVFDDGSGPALYAGGSFIVTGGVVVQNIAKWDGVSWSPLGTGANNPVYALTAFDDGNGPALYAGGLFSQVGGVAASRVARWDGSTWSPLGSGVTGSSSAVYALTAFDDGTGPALYAGGTMTTAGGISADRIARWDGSAWSRLGNGLNARVNALTVFDDGNSPSLYAGGEFDDAPRGNRVSRWDNPAWRPLGSGLNDKVYALTVFDDGSGPALIAGGEFTTAGGQPANFVARWGSPCTTSPCPADVTGNNTVDLDDLNLVLTNFGQTTSTGDTNYDGIVNLDDLNAVLTAFGTVCN